jgi:hypothetical protein
MGLEISSDKDVIHIYDNVSRINLFSKDRVYHCLKSGRRVYKAKEHNQGFEESPVSFEGSFLFITFLHSDVVVSLSNVEFGKPSFINKLADEFLNKGKGIVIVYSNIV